MMDLKEIRNDFPILKRRINGKPLVYLDNAATTQKPRQVIDAIVEYYEHHNANVRRGVHTLADESTRLYEDARKTVADFIGSSDPKELVFVRNTTEAINLVAYSWGRQYIEEGDEILISELEHHSNLVPWQILAKEKRATVQYVKVDEEGKLDLDDFKKQLTGKTKLVSLSHASNFLGTINPLARIAKALSDKRKELRLSKDFPLPAHSGLKPSGRSDSAESSDSKRSKTSRFPLFLVDGAQAVGHMPVDVKKLGCDLYAFSGHKMYGPMGIGGLWAKREILESMPPFLTGGGMIKSVTLAGTEFADLPDRFDAGTPNVADAVGLAKAVEYLKKIEMKNIREHEMELTRYAFEQLSSYVIPSEDSSDGSKSRDPAAGDVNIASLDSSIRHRRLARNDQLRIQVYGPKSLSERGGLIAFTVHLNGKEIHAHDVAQILDSEGVEVRSGHHCTMPMHTKLGLAATTRVSFGIYNTKEEVDRFVDALKKVSKVFGR